MRPFVPSHTWTPRTLIFYNSFRLKDIRMNPFTLGVLRFNEDILTSGSFYVACIFAQPLRRNFTGDVSFLDCSLGKSTQSPKLYNYKKKEKEIIATHSQVAGIPSFERLKAASFGWTLSCSQCCFNCSHTPYRALLPSWKGIAHKPAFQLWKAKEWWWFSHPVVSDSYNPMDYSPPASSVHGILQARILEWVAMFSSGGSSRPRDRTPGLLHRRQFLYQLNHQESPKGWDVV